MKRALVLLALLAAATGPVAAQTADFTPRIGVYAPLVNLLEFADPGRGFREDKADTKFSVGGRLGVWFGGNFGFEGTADYSKSGIQAYVNGIPEARFGSHIFAASIRPMFRLGSPSGVAVILSAGGGLVDRGGEYTRDLTGRTDLAGAAGLAFLVRISRHVAARIDVDGYTYTAQYGNALAGNTSALRQYDLFITFGLTGPFRNYGIPGE
jgi:hypothetical protein